MASAEKGEKKSGAEGRMGEDGLREKALEFSMGGRKMGGGRC